MIEHDKVVLGRIVGMRLAPKIRLLLQIGGTMLRDTTQIFMFLRIVTVYFQDIFVTVIE